METSSPEQRGPTAPTPPIALAVAGHDPTGGAGLAADLRTFAALGVHGVSAMTLGSVQSTTAFAEVRPMAGTFVRDQIDTLLGDVTVRALKTGMLPTPDVAAAVGDVVRTGVIPHVVVDPVVATASGSRAVDDAVDRHYRQTLFPNATVVTPNSIEAGLLLDSPVDSLDDAVDAARALSWWGPEAVVVTGGRRRDTDAVDVVVTGGRTEMLSTPWIETVNVRGSGDTLSAAIAARLAHGDDVPTAIATAHAYTARALQRAAGWRIGAGQGPLDQLGAAEA